MYVYDKRDLISFADDKPKLASFVRSYFIIIYFIMVDKDHEENFNTNKTTLLSNI